MCFFQLKKPSVVHDSVQVTLDKVTFKWALSFLNHGTFPPKKRKEKKKSMFSFGGPQELIDLGATNCIFWINHIYIYIYYFVSYSILYHINTYGHIYICIYYRRVYKLYMYVPWMLWLYTATPRKTFPLPETPHSMEPMVWGNVRGRRFATRWFVSTSSEEIDMFDAFHACLQGKT